MKQEKHAKVFIKGIQKWSATEDPIVTSLRVHDGILLEESNSLEPLQDEKVIDGSNRVLIPAGVDPQVHLRTPGQPDKETPETGIQAAIAGGYSAVLTMPNTKPVLDHPEVVKSTHKLFDLENYSEFKVCLSVAISKNQKSREAVDFDALAKSGIHAFTDDGYGVHSTEIMEQVFAASERTGLPVLQHAEVAGHGGLLAPSKIQEELGIKAYLPEAESDMVARDIECLRKFPKARYHVLHVSCPRSVELVKEAKSEGLVASCEVSPHHLYFSSEDIRPDNTHFKMNPPLRKSEFRDYLQKSLANGDIDFVATDHAPHEHSSKDVSFKAAAYGTTGLQTSLRVLLDLYRRKILTSQRLVQVFSTEGSKFLGLKDGFGGFKVGEKFRGVIIDDFDKLYEVTSSELYSKSKNNCFVGSSLPAKVNSVILGLDTYDSLKG